MAGTRAPIIFPGVSAPLLLAPPVECVRVPLHGRPRWPLSCSTAIAATLSAISSSLVTAALAKAVLLGLGILNRALARASGALLTGMGRGLRATGMSSSRLTSPPTCLVAPQTADTLGEATVSPGGVAAFLILAAVGRATLRRTSQGVADAVVVVAAPCACQRVVTEVGPDGVFRGRVRGPGVPLIV